MKSNVTDKKKADSRRLNNAAPLKKAECMDIEPLALPLCHELTLLSAFFDIADSCPGRKIKANSNQTSMQANINPEEFNPESIFLPC